MKKPNNFLKKLFFCTLFLAVSGFPVNVFPEATTLSFENDVEDLMLIYSKDEIVFSVSKRVEPVKKSPSAVYVITSDDIKYSGAKKVTDVLRMVPGVGVADLNSFYTGVQSRGFSFVPKYARQMLVLVDGRTVYSPQINTTFWDQIPLFIENIDRIEVVRGPNAALYGANAFNGVINIISKKLGDTKGGFVSAAAGNRQSFWSVARYGGKEGNFSYRATAGYNSTYKGFREVDDRMRKPQITLQTSYNVDHKTTLSIDAGYAGGDRELARKLHPEITSFYVMTKLNRKIMKKGNFLFQYYHNYQNSGMTINLNDKVREHDVEARFNWNDTRFSLVFGIGYRLDIVRNDYLAGAGYLDMLTKSVREINAPEKKNRIFKNYANLTVHLNETIDLTGALMIEHNGFIGTRFSPKGSIVYTPKGNHSFRAAVSKAYRTPSFIEEKGDITIPAAGPPFYFAQKGNRRLSPERNLAFEIGYRGSYFQERLKVNLEGFYHKIKKIILMVEAPYPVYRYENAGSNHVKGIEASFIYRPTDWWRLSGAYTFQKASNSNLKGLVIEQKASVGNRFFLPYGFVANIQLYYVDRFRFEREGWIAPSTVKDYTKLDLRISKNFFNEKLEFAAVGQNLLSPKHREYPKGLSTGKAPRVCFIEMSYSF